MPLGPQPQFPAGRRRRIRAPRATTLRLACAAAALISTGCDDGFSPLASTEARYSIYGYLDASADTQWVRVMPVRPTVPAAPSMLDAVVTLENAAGGEPIVLRDSLFRFETGPEVGSEGVFLHNFWTTSPLEPGASYRFAVTSPGSPTAEATITIPPKYDVEVWISQAPSSLGNDILRIAGLDHLALLFRRAWFTDRCGESFIRSGGPADATRTEDGWILNIRRSAPDRQGCGASTVYWRDFLIVGSGAEWPHPDDLAPDRLGGPGIPSTVSNAVGFLGGVLTREVPYEQCRLEGGVASGHCRLRYGEEMAVLHGRVWDVVCDRPRDRALVELRALAPDEDGRWRVRMVESGPDGSFRIEALEGHRDYALRVEYVTADPAEMFRVHTDTLHLAVGERRPYDVDLVRFGSCEVPA